MCDVSLRAEGCAMLKARVLQAEGAGDRLDEDAVQYSYMFSRAVCNFSSANERVRDAFAGADVVGGPCY